MIFTLDNLPSASRLERSLAYLPSPSTINSGGVTYPFPAIFTNAPVIWPSDWLTVINPSWPLDTVTNGLLCALSVASVPYPTPVLVKCISIIDPWHNGLITGADVAVRATPDNVSNETAISGYLKVCVPTPTVSRSTYNPLW